MAPSVSLCIIERIVLQSAVLSAEFSKVPFYWRELIKNTATNHLPVLSLDYKEYVNLLSHLKV